MANKIDVTFAIEVEGLVHHDRNGHAENESEVATRRELALEIAKNNPSLPVAALCHHNPHSTCDICVDAPVGSRHSIVRVFNPAYPVSKPEGNLENQYFVVKSEDLFVPDGVSADGFEITSPILDDEELKAGIPQISKVISTLRNSRLTISADYDCGFHIHAGVKTGMTVMIAKRALTLIVLAEKTLFTKLSSPTRVNESEAFSHIIEKSRFATFANSEDSCTTENKASQHLLEHFPIRLSQLKSAEWNDNNPTKWYTILNYIWLTDKMWDLSGHLRDMDGVRTGLALCIRDKNGNIPFRDAEKELRDGISKPGDTDGLGEPDEYEGCPSTIEFRYPPMSFDIQFIRSWTEISCKIVEIATRDTLAFRKVTELLYQELQKEEEGNELQKWARLLTALELEHQISFWKEQLERFEKGEVVGCTDSEGYALPERD
ncbi:hypothetical protein V8C42DRAFT_357699 [Trichoderma barbatum]